MVGAKILIPEPHSVFKWAIHNKVSTCSFIECKPYLSHNAQEHQSVRATQQNLSGKGQDSSRQDARLSLMRPSLSWEPLYIRNLSLSNQGRASCLYAAIDLISAKTVALKCYSKSLLGPLNCAQVLREVEIHIQLNHPGIIKMYAAFEDFDNVYIVLELAEGGDLYKRVKTGPCQGKLPERETAKFILGPFLSALKYLHGMSIIHRDIKVSAT